MDPNDRIRPVLAEIVPFREQKMFGGICFMVNGHMCCGFAKDRLMLRLGAEGTKAALFEPHVEPMDFTGKVMKTMVFITPEGISTDAQLAGWLRRAAEFALSEPAKAGAKP